MIGRDVPTVYSSDRLSRISAPVKELGNAGEPSEELLKYAAWHLLAAYIDPDPGPGQCPACRPMSWPGDMVCGARRTYTAKPVGVAEP